MIDYKEKRLESILEDGNNNETENLSKIFLESMDSIDVQENFEKQNSYNFIKNYNYYMLKKICYDFNKMGIKYIALKGCVLSQLLYDDPTSRLSSDIDLYIYEEYIDDVVKYMSENGFVNTNTNVSHHYIFHNNKCCIEIHQTIINPNVNVDENYLKNCITQYYFEGQVIYSLSITATLVYLFYHLYMHSYAIMKFRNVYENGKFLKTKYFLYRTQEIALFVKKHIKKINWLEFYSEINNQELNIVFKFMLLEIMKIFPKIIPPNLAQKLIEKNYLNLENDLDLSEILLQKFKCLDDKKLLENYVNQKWSSNHINIIKNHDVYYFADNTDSFSAEFSISTDKDSLTILVKVREEELFFSALDDFDTLQSDGVHLLLCSTSKYTYNSIFLFPKLVDGVYKVFAYDCLLNNLIEKQLIETSFCSTNYGYDLSVSFKNEFFDHMQTDAFFYLGIIVANCDKSSNGRKSSLVHTKLQSKWYDPTHFLRIEI